jgi:hypothetical protein
VTRAWIKKGLVFVPQRQAPWVGTHAALPACVDLGECQRVYFSSRDDRGRSHIGYIDISSDDPREVVNISSTAVVGPGLVGTFDDAGVTSSCVVRHDRRLLLFYTGWSLGVSVPFYLSIGVAVSDDEGRTFHKVARAPLFDRIEVDPYLNASPWVIVARGLWRMWYVSGTEWTEKKERLQHRYHIKYAESRDGIMWDRQGIVCIDYATPDEYAFSRPCVIYDGARLYRMWYSYRGDRYRIGYAESPDGIAWKRKDAESGIAPSRRGWDSEMVAYPCVIRHRDLYHMFYNGNGYGRTGFGLATHA